MTVFVSLYAVYAPKSDESIRVNIFLLWIPLVRKNVSTYQENRGCYMFVVLIGLNITLTILRTIRSCYVTRFSYRSVVISRDAFFITSGVNII